MRPLDQRERSILMLWSISLCIGALLLAPLAARSSIAPSDQREYRSRALHIPALARAARPKGVFVSRDPFSPDPSPEVAVRDPGDGEEVPAERGAIVGSVVRAGMPLGIILPPNRGAAGAELPIPGTASTVAGIITGDHPQALIYEGERSRIIGVDDHFEGHRVKSISSDGIGLDDGSFRHLSGHQL